MKDIYLLFIVLGLVLSGCGTQHYHRTDGNEITLILRVPKAEKVELACSLDGFTPRSAGKRLGRWEVKVLAGESFKYFYWIDGLAYMPNCRMTEKDDFGFDNCIFDPDL